MSQKKEPDGVQNGATVALGSVVGELRRESDRLLQLAAQLEADQKIIAQLTAERDQYRHLVVLWAAEQLDKRQPALPDKDVLELAKEENAMPLETFIHELEQLAEGK